MVNLTELKNSLWGMILEGGSAQNELKAERPIHITMASLNTAIESDEYVPISIEVSSANKYIVCTLSKRHNILQQTIDIEINAGENVVFSTNGVKGCVNLVGFYLPEMDDQFRCDDEDCDIDHSKQMNHQHDEDDELDFDSEDEDEDGDEDEDDEMGGEDDEDDDEEGDEDDDEDDGEDDDDEDEDDDDEEEEDDEEEISASAQNKRKAITASSKDAKKTKEEVPKLVPNQKAKEPEKKAEPKTLYGGVVIQDLKAGYGPEAKIGKSISVYYAGKLKSGKPFDSCLTGKPFKFRLGKGEVIKGWDIGFENMKVGGKRIITVPPHMGYGSKRMGHDIPPNSTLVFEVELKAVN